MMIGRLAYPIFLALIVPLLALWLYPSLATSLETAAGFAKGAGPSIFVLLLAMFAYGLTFFARPALLKRYLGGAEFRMTLRAAILWSALGTLAWLGLVFFYGELPLLDRTFAATQTALMALLLLLGGPILRGAKLFWALLATLPSLALLLWIMESGPAVFSLPAQPDHLDEVFGALLSRPLVVPMAFVVATIAGYALIMGWWLR